MFGYPEPGDWVRLKRLTPTSFTDHLADDGLPAGSLAVVTSRSGGSLEVRQHDVGAATSSTITKLGVNRLDRSHHLFDDRLRPQWTVETRLGQAEQRVSQGDGDQDARVEQRSETGQLSPPVGAPASGPQRSRVVGCRVVEAILHCLAGEGVQRGPPLRPPAFLVRQDVLQPHAAMAARPRPMERHQPRLQQLDQGRAADPEEVGGLLRGEELIDRRNRDRLALAHGSRDRDEHPEGLQRQGDRLAVRSHQGGRLGVALQEAGKVQHRFEVLRRQYRLLQRIRAHAPS